ncbi:aspartate aminotransferase family protein [Ramlibacter monticola]|uniref:Aspartate aminotransferase family protein n=1 Tax=Ramlibacter monticola TaxID=1926872 RepID=A0A936Z046_9BURK|nr:aspartate aminotransferase family protein [Ramlibacter monticola]MBL0392128.1 aspartate aminotransferase family protein [Ramlibacter monticola]
MSADSPPLRTEQPPFTGRTTKEWQAADAAHFLHPFTDHQALATKGVRVITRGEGVYVWDSDGQRILDAMSGLWCVNVGYGQEALIEAATQQMRTLPYYNAFFQTTTPAATALAERLAARTPAQFRHVFFCGSGSEANDTVIRLVRRYWDVMGQAQRKVIVSRLNAYHGSTMAAASLGGMAAMHAQGDLPIPGIVHIDQPHYWAHREGAAKDLGREEFGLLAAHWLEEKILAIGADKVAAFIGEPVQGAGGVIVPPSTYWPEIQRICDRHGILLVSDEVVCGFGRTGRWWGCEAFGSKPDLITFAKGVTSGYVPLGGVMVGERMARVLIEQGGEFEHGYTYSGHPVACAVGLANLDVIERQDLVTRVREDTGPYLAQQLAQLMEHPMVGEVQSCGLMAAVQLCRNVPLREAFAPEIAIGMVCRKHCFDNGLVMRAVGDRMIVAPPLVITRAQIDEMFGLVRQALDRTHAEAHAAGWLAR